MVPIFAPTPAGRRGRAGCTIVVAALIATLGGAGYVGDVPAKVKRWAQSVHLGSATSVDQKTAVEALDKAKGIFDRAQELFNSKKYEEAASKIVDGKKVLADARLASNPALAPLFHDVQDWFINCNAESKFLQEFKAAEEALVLVEKAHRNLDGSVEREHDFEELAKSAHARLNFAVNAAAGTVTEKADNQQKCRDLKSKLDEAERRGRVLTLIKRAESLWKIMKTSKSLGSVDIAEECLNAADSIADHAVDARVKAAEKGECADLKVKLADLKKELVVMPSPD
jgi:hypothetical protein